MKEPFIIQGRRTTEADIELVRRFIAANPSWNRTRLSRELCRLWDWRGEDGREKDMACRSFLLKLEGRGVIVLPPREYRHLWGARSGAVAYVPHAEDAIDTELARLRPIVVEPIADERRKALFKCLLSRYHYLPYRAVGKNMAYMAHDREGRPLACLLFGSAAWACAPRDRFIGWDAEKRETKLHLITGNTRFLILPWVRVPHLASHVLSMAAKRIAGDWRDKYGHPIHMLETFVETDRFAGTCYRAAGWTYAGKTTGRSRQDRYMTMQVPEKAVWLYPLTRRFREELCA